MIDAPTTVGLLNFNFNFIYYLTKEKYKMVASRQ